MKVAITQKLFAHRDVFRLSDLHLVWGDLDIARQDFEYSLSDLEQLPRTRNLKYSLAASGLIHYRRAFDQTSHRRVFLTEKIVRRCAPDLFDLHERLISLCNKFVAHSENEYEQCLVTVLVATDDDGCSTFRGLGMQTTSIETLSQDDTRCAIRLINDLIEHHVIPEIKRLETSITTLCQSLSSDDLRMLPDGFAPPGSSDPRTRRSWPHPGSY